MKKITSIKNCVAFSVLALLCSGCGSTRFNIDVSGISTNDAQVKKSYKILPNMEGVDVDDLQFQEYAAYLRRALNKQGFAEANDGNNELTIFLRYGISDPSERTASVPIIGQTGGGTSTFNANTTSNIYSSSGNSYSGNSYTSGTVYKAPTYGVVGSNTYSYSVYSRFVEIDAVDYEVYKETKKLKSVWKTTIKSTGSSGDLRRVFPILIAAAVPHLGTNTGQAVNVVMTEQKEIVKEIKGLSEPK